MQVVAALNCHAQGEVVPDQHLQVVLALPSQVLMKLAVVLLEKTVLS